MGMWVWDAVGSGCILGYPLTSARQPPAVAQPLWQLDGCGGGAGADAQAEPGMTGLKTRRTIVLHDHPRPWLGVVFFLSELAAPQPPASAMK